MADPSTTLYHFLHEVYVPLRMGLDQKTITQMEITIRCIERWAGRTLTLADLSEPFLRAFLCDYHRTAAGATVNAKRCQLLALWRCAWSEETLPMPPRGAKVPRAKQVHAIPEAWTPEQVGRIFRECDNLEGRIGRVYSCVWWRTLLMVLYDTGERIHAALATLMDDLDIEGGSIIFRQTKTRQPRWCRLHADTVDACRMIYSTKRQIVWPWPWSREWLYEHFRRILVAAEVPHGRQRGGMFHRMRRTSGTLVEQAGGDGARHLGNTRAVFERSYRDPRFAGASVSLLPRPVEGGGDDE